AHGSVISASLFGALAGSGALPFPREAFEETIRRSGKGVEASLRAFDAGFQAVAGEAPNVAIETTEAAEPSLTPPDAPLPASHAPGIEARHTPSQGLSGPEAAMDRYRDLLIRIERDVPEAARDLARAGLRKVVDFQDLDYGADYLTRLAALVARDESAKGYALTLAGAKYLANAMAYDDVIRVADLKTRAARARRVRDEVGVRDGQLIQVTEYMHPRMEEVCGCLPAGLGRAIEARPKLFAALDRLVSRGRRVRTDGVFWFSVLYTVSALRPHRRRLLRHAVEAAHMEDWLATAHRLAPENYDLAVEVLRCRRLIKGYSDTHMRGLSKFDRVLSALPLLEPREDGADWLRRLREAALMDEPGEMLDGALKTVATL
ncbi:MAG: indolepyruvate oxidoreductase subunit beta family protein, partial [Pseudomonadota bacterium]